MTGLFIVLSVSLGAVMNKAEKDRPAVKNMHKLLGAYALIAILLCIGVLGLAFREAVFLLDVFPGSAIFGWIAIGVAVTYIAGLFRSLCKLMTLQPGALRLTRIFLLSFAPFITFFPLVVFALCAWWTGGDYTFSDYSYSMEPGIMFFSGCVFSLPWLLYFTVSSRVKELAL